MKKSELKQLIKECILEGFDDEDSSKTPWGTPNELLSDVMQTIEKNVEWPLTEIMDYKEVNKLLWPIRNAINKKLGELEK